MQAFHCSIRLSIGDILGIAIGCRMVDLCLKSRTRVYDCYLKCLAMGVIRTASAPVTIEHNTFL